MKLNHPINLKETSQRTRLKKKRDKHPIPRGTEVRRLGPKTKERNSKPRPTSRVGAVT